VVDASVSAAWLLPNEATPYTESVLQATADREVWVPALWLLEVGNLVISAQRRKRIDAAKRRELVMATSALRLRVDREPVSMANMDDLAASHGLTAYDAAYLELAMRWSLPMATQGAAMRKATKASSVALAEI